MKKLSKISNQIKDNTFSYTGKGAFEAIVKKYKDTIVLWLEDLVPLQEQIDNLFDLTSVQFQKRNYTRILSKFIPDEYKQFVELNILVRDAQLVAQYYNNDLNLQNVYSSLVSNKYLKYPGKYDKYVEFDIFQKFVMIYKDELLDVAGTVQEKNDIAIPEKVMIEESKDEKTNWTNLLLGKK
jgi:hypothetical protein